MIEAGVLYEHEPQGPGWTRCVYHWLHIETRQFGTKEVWLYLPDKLPVLLNHWNRQDGWKYWTT